MPNIPKYQLGGLPNDPGGNFRQSDAVANINAGGGQALARGMGALGQAAFNVEADLRQVQNLRDENELTTAYLDYEKAVTGKYDELAQLQGENARGAAKTFNDFARQSQLQFKAGLRTEEQRRLFDFKAQPQSLQFTRSMTRHENDQEIRVWADNKQIELDNLSQKYAASLNDAQTKNQILHNANDVLLELQQRGGWSDQILEHRREQFVRDGVVSNLNANISSGNLKEALTTVNRYRDILGTETAAKINKQIADAQKAQTRDALFYESLAKQRQKDAFEKERSDLYINMNRGEIDYSTIEHAYDAGVITADERTTFYKTLDRQVEDMMNPEAKFKTDANDWSYILTNITNGDIYDVKQLQLYVAEGRLTSEDYNKAVNYMQNVQKEKSTLLKDAISMADDVLGKSFLGGNLSPQGAERLVSCKQYITNVYQDALKDGKNENEIAGLLSPASIRNIVDLYRVDPMQEVNEQLQANTKSSSFGKNNKQQPPEDEKISIQAGEYPKAQQGQSIDQWIKQVESLKRDAE